MGILDVDLTGPSIPRFLGLEDAKIKQAPGGWLPVEVHQAQTLSPLPTPTTLLSSSEAESGASQTHNGHINSKDDDVPSTANAEVINTHGGLRLPQEPPSSSALHPSHSDPNVEPTSSDPGTPIGSLHAISLAFLLPARSSAVIWRGPKKTAMVRQFLTDVLWPPSGIDYLLIDTPPGTSDEHIALAETLQSVTSSSTPNSTLSSPPAVSQPRLAGAVIVTTPQAVAVSDVRKELNFCKKTGIDVLGVVENMAGFVCECCGEQTDLFGRGGGELMAQEFGVRFLGGVSLDVAWGRLVEEGRRPVYGAVDSEIEEQVERIREGERESVDEDGIKDDNVQDDESKKLMREGGLLVDKYRSCKLCETFAGITKQLVDIVEGGTEAG